MRTSKGRTKNMGRAKEHAVGGVNVSSRQRYLRRAEGKTREACGEAHRVCKSRKRNRGTGRTWIARKNEGNSDRIIVAQSNRVARENMTAGGEEGQRYLQRAFVVYKGPAGREHRSVVGAHRLSG